MITHTGVLPLCIRLDITCEVHANLTLHNKAYYEISTDLVLGYESKPTFASPHAVISTCRGQMICDCASVQD